MADLIILGVMLLSAVIGLVRGLLKEVLSLAVWIAAAGLAMYFGPTLAAQLSAQISDDGIRLVVAFIAIFIGALILGAVLQWLVGLLIRRTGLTGTDRFLGFLFGAARGFIVCVVALIALRQFVAGTEWWQTSLLVPQLLAFEQQVLGAMGRAGSWLGQFGA